MNINSTARKGSNSKGSVFFFINYCVLELG